MLFVKSSIVIFHVNVYNISNVNKLVLFLSGSVNVS